MSEENNDKDALELFFQKKADEYDIPFREEDWLRLEEKLNVRDVQRGYQHKVRWIAAASLLFVSLFGYFTYNNYLKINEIRQHLSDEMSDDSGQDRLLNEFPADQFSTPGMDEEDENIVEEIETPSAARDSREPVTETVANNFSVDPATNSGESGREPRGRELVASRVPVLTRAMTTASQLNNPTIPDNMLNRITVPGDFATGTPSNEELSSHTTTPGLLSANMEEDIYGETYIPRPNRWAFGLVMSPDLTSIDSFSNFYSPGYKVGFTLEYNLNARWKVSTGVIQSMVRYSSKSLDYNPPVQYSSLFSMNGECLLLDIPLSFKYNFLDFDRSGFFATAGLSSYLMLSEEYNFIYDTYGETQSTSTWSDRTGTFHLFSNAGFSIGYEVELHRNWNIRAEPFVRVPIREVGWANVRLYSMGSFISVNYKL
ncbi:MAG: outer membrane beta-barrel protein [Balneolales bacterium]